MALGEIPKKKKVFVIQLIRGSIFLTNDSSTGRIMSKETSSMWPLSRYLFPFFFRAPETRRNGSLSIDIPVSTKQIFDRTSDFDKNFVVLRTLLVIDPEVTPDPPPRPPSQWPIPVQCRSQTM